MCGWCGEDFSAFVKTEQKYCSHECAAAARHDPSHKCGKRRIQYTGPEEWKEQLREASRKSPSPKRGKRVWLVCGVTSMYLGLDGLLGIIRYQLNHSPYDREHLRFPGFQRHNDKISGVGRGWFLPEQAPRSGRNWSVRKTKK